MFKQTILLSTLYFLTSISWGQKLNVNLGSNVLYRGFNNTVTIESSSELQINNWKVNCQGCSISPNDEANSFLLKVKSRDTLINVDLIQQSNGKTSIVQTLECKIENLPVPWVFMGAAYEGKRASRFEPNLFVKYPAGVFIADTFTIESWECNVNDKIYSGKGKNLSQEVMNVFKTLRSKSNDYAVITVSYTGPDGVSRKKSATFYF